MKDIYNPTQEDILNWAISKDLKWPAGDWDYYVMSGEHNNDFLILRLANDKTCPHKKFFVHALYYFVGEYFHELQCKPEISSQQRMLDKRSRIKKLINLSKKNTSTDIEVQNWTNDVESLFSKKIDFDLNYWMFSKAQHLDN